MRSRFIQTFTPFKGGTKMVYGNRLYHFLPNEFGDYVAEVEDDGHYEAILSIGAGYQPYSDTKTQQAAEAIQARIDADAAVRRAAETRAAPGPLSVEERTAKMRAAKAAKRATQEE